MRTNKAKVMVASALFLALVFAGVTKRVRAQASFPGSQGSTLPNYSPPSLNFTASGQTKSFGIGGVSYCTISVTGVGFTTATWILNGSSDGGATYHPLADAAYAAGALTTTTTTLTTASVPKLYIANVAGHTNLQIVTSGTFTATNAVFHFICTPNKGLL